MPPNLIPLPPAPRSYGTFNWLGAYTLLNKEVRRFLKVYIQTIMSPVITALIFLAVFALSIGGHSVTVNDIAFLEFLAPGLIMMTIVQNAFANTSSSLIIAKVQGNIVDMLMPPLTAFEQTAAISLGGVIRGIMVGITVGLVMICFVPLHFIHPWAIIYYSFMGSLMLSLLGMIGGIWSDKFDQMATITNFIITPLSFLSGTFYSISHLPKQIHQIAFANPFFYMIDGFRYGFIDHADGSIIIGVLYIATINTALLLLAYRMLKTGYKLRA